MALIQCPYCAKRISDRAESCPGCGCRIVPTAPSANEPGAIAEGSSFSGSVSDFGIRNCLKAESDNFWMRRWGQSVYTSSAHSVPESRRIDRTKGQITKIWVLGLLGTLGLHYFSVGRILTGSLRLLYGALLWIIGLLVSFAPQPTQDVSPLRIMLVFLVFALIPAVIELIVIWLGMFRDVFKNRIT